MRVFLSIHIKQKDLGIKIFKLLSDYDIVPITKNLRDTINTKIFIPEELDKAIGHYDYVIVVISNDYIHDPWLNTELATFLSEEGRRRKGNIVIPLIYGQTEMPLILRNPDRAFFYLNKNISSVISNLRNFLFKELQVFVVMRLGDPELDRIYTESIRQAILDNDFKPLQITELLLSMKISQQILNEIKSSQVVIADLTFERPNCYFEAGYALALGKELILTAREDTKVHFDLYDNKRIVWKDGNDLRNKLFLELKQIKNRIFNIK